MPNRLAEETSPYLLQHKDNPVEWLPWGEEAFAKAKSEDKPVFLSVGYSSCHWCHVMAHESFEDEEVASILNRNFVSVKVDREERPDVDEAYMTAVQLQSGRGGWPMSVFLTPGRAPFFAGTYFPKHDRAGHPGFLTILRQLDRMWRSEKEEVLQAAESFAESLTQAMETQAPKSFRALDRAFVQVAFDRAVASFDATNGGFGGAPKFPPHSAIELCLALSTTSSYPEELRTRAGRMADLTLEKMVFGGIHDHVGGGIHRYSTDEVWLLPHFEKMLYDNALMLGNLARALHRLPVSKRALVGLLGWLEEEMRTPEGLYCSAFDADSEGEEGKYYVWTEEEVQAALGDRADVFIKAYGFEKDGNFLDEATHQKTGANIPHLKSDDRGRFPEELSKLRAIRKQRVRPMRDDKALIGWNGLVLAGLVQAGELETAKHLAESLWKYWAESESHPHQISQGKASGHAYLEDVAGLFWGIVLLAEKTGDPKWKEAAEQLLAFSKEFRDGTNGDYFAVSENHERLFGRAKPVFDQPIPSANALMARSLIRLGRLEEARSVIEATLGWVERAPGSTEALLLAAVELLEEEGKGQRIERELKPGEIVKAELVVPKGANGWIEGEVVLTIREGFHINTNDPPARWLIPTQLSFEGTEGEAEFPKGEGDRYEGKVSIPIRFRASSDDYEIKLRCQPCSETECLPEIELTLR